MSFHAGCYGKNITLSENDAVASRENPVKAAYLPFGQGATFTSAPVDTGVTFMVEILAIDNAYAGTLCMGLTNNDPTSFKRLPTATVPDFANKPGNWCISLEDKLDVGDWVTFNVRQDGKTISLSVNGCVTRDYQHGDKIDSSKPLWGIIDVYGSVTKVRLFSVKSSDRAAVADTASDGDMEAILNEKLISSEGSTPLDVNLLILGESNAAADLIRGSLLRQKEGVDEGEDAKKLMSITHCGDWSLRSKDTDLERHVAVQYAECVVGELKKRQSGGGNIQPSSGTAGVELEGAFKDQIFQRVKFSLLKQLKGLASESSDDVSRKPGLTVLSFSSECLEKSLHELFLPSPIASPTMLLYVIDYDSINIDQDNPSESKFITELHAVLQMIYTRVRVSTDEHSDHHKQYLSPPIILVGVYEESDQASIKVEEIESLIRTSLEEKVYQPHVVSLYHAIPHQDGEMVSKSSKMIEDLRKHISRTAQGELETDLRIPLWWALLRKQLLNLKADGKLSLSPEEIAKLCSDTQVAVPDVTKALHYLNESGDLLAATNKNGLFVFLEQIKTMELVLKAMTVVDPSERWSTHDRMWSKLKKEGVLSEPLLNHIWKDDLANKELLLDLMMHHHLMYDMTEREEKKQFLVPSLLLEVPVSERPATSDGDVRIYLGSDGCFPGSMFVGLCLSLRRWAVENDHSVSRLTKNLCEFTIGANIDLIISRSYSDHSVIQVDIKCSDRDESENGERIPDPQMSIMIKNEIKAHLDELINASHYREIDASCLVKCTTCDDLVSLDDCLSKPSVICPKSHKIPTSKFQRWFDLTRTTTAEESEEISDPGNERTNRIFMSFSFRAKDKAGHVKEKIDGAFGAGTCWICTEQIRGGQGIRREISRAMKNASVVICAISEGYTDSKECQSEVNLARELKKEIIPVLLDEVEWPLKESSGEISEMSYIFAGKLYQAVFSEKSEDLDKDIERLIATLRKEIGEE